MTSRCRFSSRCCSEGVDDFILATGRLGEQQIIEEASAGNVPVVLVNRDSGVGRYPLVSGDNASGITSAVTHLVELGHRHIVHVAGPPNFSTALSRSKAFEAAALNAGILHDTINAESFTIDAGCAAAEVLLQRRGEP